MKFWDRTIEFKSVIIASSMTLLGFLATLFLFWYGHYEIPLAILTSGVVIILTWLGVLIYYKKSNKPKIRFDIMCIYLRLFLIIAIAILFSVIQLTCEIVIISPIFLIVGYFVISLVTLTALIGRKNNV